MFLCAIFCYDCMTMPIRLETLPWRIYLCVYTWTWFLGQSCILLRHFSTFVDLAEWNCRRIKRSRVENFSPPNCRLWWPLRQESIDYKLGEEQNFANLTPPLLALKKWWQKAKNVTLYSFNFQLGRNYTMGAENPVQKSLLCHKSRRARVESWNSAFALENSGLLDLVLFYNSVIGWQWSVIGDWRWLPLAATRLLYLFVESFEHWTQITQVW